MIKSRIVPAFGIHFIVNDPTQQVFKFRDRYMYVRNFLGTKITLQVSLAFFQDYLANFISFLIRETTKVRNRCSKINRQKEVSYISNKFLRDRSSLSSTENIKTQTLILLKFKKSYFDTDACFIRDLLLQNERITKYKHS